MTPVRRARLYMRIVTIYWRAAVSTEFEYRINFGTGFLLSLFWMLWAAAGLAVYFQFSGSLAGWDYAELLVVTGLFFGLNGIRQAAFQPNLEQVTEYVRLGTLDFLMIRPADTQIMVSLRRLRTGYLLDPVFGAVFIASGVVLTDPPLTVFNLAGFVLLLGTSLVTLYSLMVALMARSVRLLGAPELQQVAFGAVELSRFPVQLYRDPLQTLLVAVPIVLLTTLPAEALLNKMAPHWLLTGPALAAAALGASRILFIRSLRGYIGASS